MKPAKYALQGLYAITDETLLPEDCFIGKITTVLKNGCKIIQYRNKHGSSVLRQKQAEQLRKLCTQYDACLLINDDVELALACKADGVHLGQNDIALNKARKQLGSNAIIGITCHDSLDLAVQAQHEGADYVAFGSFFPSAIKPHAQRAPKALLIEAKAQLNIPLVAIGGITRDNGRQLIDCGADMLAVISDLWADDSTTSLEQRTNAFMHLFV
ncbi:MAG: thiamine phosphate synthase [Pseudomonadales bacterium]|nr:thiamine phosphate synthase [Pseudomonadales bacterium]